MEEHVHVSRFQFKAFRLSGHQRNCSISIDKSKQCCHWVRSCIMQFLIIFPCPGTIGIVNLGQKQGKICGRGWDCNQANKVVGSQIHLRLAEVVSQSIASLDSATNFSSFVSTIG